MKASESNIDTLMCSIHKKIEEYAHDLATQIDKGYPVEHVTYPPNNGFTDDEIESLNPLSSNSNLKSAIRKLVADSIAGAVFDIFNIIDGTSDPELELGEWTGICLVDKTNEFVPNDMMLHDQFFESYWTWRKIRTTKEWTLDIYDE